MFDSLFKTYRFKKKFNSRYKKILEIYLDKDFSRYKTREEKEILLNAWLQEVLLCLKQGLKEYFNI